MIHSWIHKADLDRFRNVALGTAQNWLKVFAVYHNSRQLNSTKLSTTKRLSYCAKSIAMNRRELLLIAAGSGTTAILSSSPVAADSGDQSDSTSSSDTSDDTVQITVTLS